MHHNDENTPLCVSQHTFSLFPFSLYLSLRLTFCMFLCPSIFFPSLSICSSLPECLSSRYYLSCPPHCLTLLHTFFIPLFPLCLSCCLTVLPSLVLSSLSFSLFLMLFLSGCLYLSTYLTLSHILCQFLCPSVTFSLCLSHLFVYRLSLSHSPSFCLS